MINTAKSLRLQLGIFGRTNVGKSSFLNMIANQDVALTSEVAGTTTDVVEKTMELLPIGPVCFLDTAGIDDRSELAEKRIGRTRKIFQRADIITLVVEPNIWTKYEEDLVKEIKELDIALIIAINKIDETSPNQNFLDTCKSHCDSVIQCSSLDLEKRDEYIINYKNEILKLAPKEYFQSMAIIGDLLPKGGVSIFIIPIDNEAPKGRIILPQVQAMRDILDNDQLVLVCKETEYKQALASLKNKPDLVVCDSQVVHQMVADTPDDVKCTTFSILFSRFKGNLLEEVKGVAHLAKLKQDDKVLIAEACSHHSNEDDIGRVKIPKWMQEFLGHNVDYKVAAGRDYPDNVKDFNLIIHCGACMITRTEKLVRINNAKKAGIPITNYGIAISLLQGVLERVLEPFPAELQAYKEILNA